MIKTKIKSVLIVDDSMYMRTLIRQAIDQEKFNIIGEAGEGGTAMNLIRQLTPDIVILDNVLPDMLGIEILEFIRTNNLDSKVIMVSAMHQQVLTERAKLLGAEGYVTKPFESEELITMLRQVS